MDHIVNYFNNTKNNLVKNISKKEIIVDVIKKLTKIDLETKNITIKKDFIYIKIFGIKKTKILILKESILESLRIDHLMNFIDLK
jgi:hypothetical protein